MASTYKIILHKATVGVNRFVNDLTLELKNEAHAETNPHPDFHVEGRRLAELLYDHLPGATVRALRTHLTDLCTERPDHGVSGSGVSYE